MAFDDIIDDKEGDKEKDETEELKNKLGVEDKEELEKLDDRLDDAMNGIITNDKRIDDLETEVRSLKSLIKELIKLVDNAD